VREFIHRYHTFHQRLIEEVIQRVKAAAWVQTLDIGQAVIIFGGSSSINSDQRACQWCGVHTVRYGAQVNSIKHTLNEWDDSYISWARH
jgi:hypothetical protein